MTSQNDPEFHENGHHHSAQHHSSFEQSEAPSPELSAADDANNFPATHQGQGQNQYAGQVDAQAQTPQDRAVAYGNMMLGVWIDWNNKALVVKTIMAANIAVFVAMLAMSGGESFFSPTVWFLLQWGANCGAYTLHGEYWRLISAAFLHSGIMHIGMNMLVLWDVGPVVEKIYGSKRFLILYFFAALTASLNTLFWNPGTVSVGASGAVFGVFGALLAFYQTHRSSIPAEVIKDKSRLVAAVIGYNIIYGIMQPNIDNAGHLGGVVGGFIIGAILSPKEPLQRRIRLTEALGTVLALAACFGFWTVDKQVPMAKSSQYYYFMADRLLKQGKTAEAIQGLDHYIDKEHGDDAKTARLMRIELLKSDPKTLDKAFADAESALKEDPNSLELLKLYADMLMRKEKPAQAVDATTRGLRLAEKSGDRAELLTLRAQALIELNKLADAIPALDEALKLKPEMPSAYALRGLCELDRPDAAVKDFQKSIDLGEDNPIIFRSLGLAHFLNANYAEAAVDYGRSIGSGNDQSTLYYFSFVMKALAEELSGNAAQASQSLLEGSRQANPESWPGKVIAFLQGKISADDLQKQARDQGQLAEARTYIGLSLVAKGQQQSAMPLFQWVVNNGPKEFIEYRIAERFLAAPSASP